MRDAGRTNPTTTVDVDQHAGLEVLDLHCNLGGVHGALLGGVFLADKTIVARCRRTRNPLGPGLSDNGSAPAESGVHTNMWFSPNAPVAYHDITFRNGQTLVARIEK